MKKSKKAIYHIFPSAVGKDLWANSIPPFRKNKEGNAKFELSDELTQEEMKYLLEVEGCTNIIYKIEG